MEKIHVCLHELYMILFFSAHATFLELIKISKIEKEGERERERERKEREREKKKEREKQTGRDR